MKHLGIEHNRPRIADKFQNTVISERRFEERLHITVTVFPFAKATKVILHAHGRYAPLGSKLATDFKDMDEDYHQHLDQFAKALLNDLLKAYRTAIERDRTSIETIELERGGR